MMRCGKLLFYNLSSFSDKFSLTFCYSNVFYAQFHLLYEIHLFRAGGKGNAVQKCSSCHGNGIKISIQPLGPGMVQQVQRVCPDCSGEGELKYAQ